VVSIPVRFQHVSFSVLPLLQSTINRLICAYLRNLWSSDMKKMAPLAQALASDLAFSL